MPTNATERTIEEVPIKQINVSKFNVRKDLNDEGIIDLAENIKKYGQLQPVLLMGSFGNPPYELIVGQRRYNAIKKLGRTNITAIFKDNLSNIDAIVISLAENLQRSNLTYEDMSNAITKIYDHYSDAKKVAKILSITTATVYEYLRVEKAITPKVKSFLSGKKLPKEDIKRAVKMGKGDENKTLSILKEISKLTKYQKDRAIEISEEEPNANATEIISKAKKPRITMTLVLSLSNELNKGLDEAIIKLKEDREVIALKALRVWLTDNGFIN